MTIQDPGIPPHQGSIALSITLKEELIIGKNTIGVSGEKLTLGVPFYGYDFQNSTTVKSFTYGLNGSF